MIERFSEAGDVGICDCRAAGLVYHAALVARLFVQGAAQLVDLCIDGLCIGADRRINCELPGYQGRIGQPGEVTAK